MSGVQVPLSLGGDYDLILSKNINFFKLTVKNIKKDKKKKLMPQLDPYIAMSQVFWFTIFFLGFYVLMVRDILPGLARSIKLRQKKVGTGSSTSNLDEESAAIIAQTASTLESSLKDSRTLLTNISTTSSDWLESSIKEVNEKTLLDVNKSYIKTIGELKGRSFLIEETIKQK
jgi:hypothetical protein